jgi:DNA-binding response OmpR family regulator
LQIDLPRVLIVEDFEDLRKLVAFYLSARGYQVSEAATGKAAIEAAMAENPNFILLDFRLPDINGVELARKLRQLPQAENTPIVGLSADCRSNRQRESLREAGIVEYLEKPIRLKDLDAVIERFLSNSTQPLVSLSSR